MNSKILVGCAALLGLAVVGCNNPPATPTNCGNGMCDTGETPAMCPADCSEPETRTYVISTIDTHNASATESFGFDLDGMIDGATEFPCTAALDYTSSVTGTVGVDNQLAGLLPTLEAAAMIDVNMAIQEQIQGGTLLLVFEVSDINSFNNDDSVMVHLALGTASGTLMTDGNGLAAGQTFTEMMNLGMVSGSIEGGRLNSSSPTLPLAFSVMDMEVTLTLREVVIGGRISATGLTDGEFGAIVAVTDIVTIGQMVAPDLGIDVGLIEMFAMPDIDPDATGEHCASISAGMGFTTVDATLE